jgi:hypothetical protein
MDKNTYIITKFIIRCLGAVGAGNFYSKYPFTNSKEHSVVVGSVVGFVLPVSGFIPMIYQVIKD